MQDPLDGPMISFLNRWISKYKLTNKRLDQRTGASSFQTTPEPVQTSQHSQSYQQTKKIQQKHVEPVQTGTTRTRSTRKYSDAQNPVGFVRKLVQTRANTQGQYELYDTYDNTNTSTRRRIRQEFYAGQRERAKIQQINRYKWEGRRAQYTTLTQQSNG